MLVRTTSASQFFLLLSILFSLTVAQQDATCSALKPCKSGCCSKFGSCGFGDEFCGDGCKGTCDAVAECGKYAPKENFDCPLNFCCSKHGFCGYTQEFCDGCQNKGGCPDPPRPKCSAKEGAMEAEVRIAYYGAWSASRSCDSLQPENIPAGVLTHINVAFEYVSAGHEITDENGPVVGRVSRLKSIYPGLRVNIALGGWTFNDAPTDKRFSDMVSTVPNRQKFITSLIRYMQKYALDGVELDWEYPVAEDRGGKPADYDNLVLLVAEIREAFDSYDPGWEITMTLPSSFWYLRGFKIKELEKHLDWFNVMTYDIHGIWDQKNVWTGPFLKGHTNLTEIEDGLDLLWRNGISSDKVVMGYGFYGRGFTMTDTQCSKPPSCTFSGPSYAGDCTNEAGILSYGEVIGKAHELGADTSYDAKSSVKWMVYGGNQWISWDDADSFNDKKKYMFSRCLKGLMIWELGLDTADNQALIGLFGEEAVTDSMKDASLNPEEKKKLTKDLSAYNGQFCYVAEKCVKSDSDKSDKGSCMAGYSVLETGHAMDQIRSGFDKTDKCSEGSFHRICCPTKAMPKNCEWLGAPERSFFGCDGSCGDSQFELAKDTYLDRKGEGNCFSGHRSLCCDSTEILNKCHWTDCDWTSDENGNCGKDEVSIATRYDQDDGDMCKKQTALGNGGAGPTTHYHFRSFCCPKDDALEDCKWANDASRFTDGAIYSQTALGCVQKGCPADELAITEAVEPSSRHDLEQKMGGDVCEVWAPPPSTPSIEYQLCCSPPSRFTQDWPVNPAWLWDGAYTDEDDDVSWAWSDNFGNNNKDTSPDNLEEDPGEDPYGFVMLDGPPGSIAKQFDRQFTVLTRDEPVNIKPRSFVTSDPNILDSTFEHAEETVRVYCNFPHDSKHCTEIFMGGARDTIIKLPAHVGEGPWARVVSMEPDQNPPELPSWIIRKRDSDATHRNGVYKLTFDYDFHLIQPRADGDVFMRVDYTNLQEYWDDVTDEDPKNNAKRSASVSAEFESWKSRVDKAKRGAYTDHDGAIVNEARGNTDFSPEGPVPRSPYHTDSPSSLSIRDASIERRWWGTFVNWLKKVTTITSEEAGHLTMGLSKVFNIWSGRLRCENPSGVTLTAGLDVTADVRLQMNAKYAYYFSGTVVPPKVIDTFVYIGAQPNVYAGITIRGDAELAYQSEVKKLIQTVTYPGLSIKGIATVGPSLDLYGRIEGRITVSGQLKVGAKYTFDEVEMYLPNNEETHDRASSKLKSFDKDETGLAPVFQADVKANVDAHLRITPELNCGIKVGGDIGPLTKPFIDGHVFAFMNTSLHFTAHVTAATNGQSSAWEYGYNVELLWRVDNCGTFFSDVVLPLPAGGGQTLTLPGICSSVRAYLANHGVISDSYPLTFDSYNQGKRRTQTCTENRNPCGGANGENARKKALLGPPFSNANNLVNCDEFPFASSEEGGYGWHGDVYPTAPLGVTRTCVPEWQNSLQGNCNSLLNNIETNVEYFNNADNPTGIDPDKASWQSWNSNSWNVKKSWTAGGDPGRQRVTKYDTEQPYSLGGQNDEEQANRFVSWFHKRNFTLNLVTNNGQQPATFPNGNFDSGTIFKGSAGVPDSTTVTDAAWIMCAVSLRGQERFRFGVTKKKTRKHNGYCWDGATTTLAWNGVANFQRLSYFSCDIDFVGAPHAPSKRNLMEPIGYFGSEAVYGVRRSADYHEVEVKIPIEEIQLPDSRQAYPLSS